MRPGRTTVRHRPSQAPAKPVARRLDCRESCCSPRPALPSTSLIAGGATAIYAAWHFQQMPSLGLLTNLTAMPIVSVVVMPFAVLGTLAMPFGLDGPFFDVMGMGLGATIAIARWFSERSPVDVVGLVSPAAVIVLTVALLIADGLHDMAARGGASGRAWPACCCSWIGRTPIFSSPKTPGSSASPSATAASPSTAPGPNEFTIDNWKRALLAETLVTPEAERRAVRAAR